MKKTIEDYGKNLDRIKKKLPAEREELSRERIELQDGKMCDLVAYDVKAYGYVAVSYTHLTLPTNSLV